jgi:hypothetical protein
MRLRRPVVALAALLLVATSLGVPSALAAPGAPAVGTGEPPSGGNGTLALQVSPVTADVTVNGSAVRLGANGDASLNLTAGSYPVVATADGYKAFEGNVTVLGGQVAYLTIQLIRTPAASTGSSLSLGSFPVAVTATVIGILAIVSLGILLLRAPRPRAPEPPAPGTPAEPTRDEGPE